MKKILRIPLLLVALLLSSIPLFAHDFEVDGIYYNILSSTAKTVEVTYSGSSYAAEANEYTGNVTIPETVTRYGTTYTVTSIGDYAFCDCTGLTSVTIPNSVTSIGFAFVDCTGLTTVNFNATNCTSMGNSYNSVFSSCTAFKTLNIGDNVVNIPDYAFKDCTSLTSVNMGNSVTTIGVYAFYGCAALTEVNITDLSAWLIIDFGNGIANPLCFAGKLKLNGSEVTNLIIPENITYIKDVAFYGCTSLTSVTIPNSVIHIGRSAFADCSGLTSVTIGDSIHTIGTDAFKNCTSLQIVNFNATGCYLMGDYDSDVSVFSGCTALKTLNIGENVTYIPDDAFRNCTGLTEVTIPNSVTEIGNDAFSFCTGLTTVNFNATNCTSMGGSGVKNPAFYGCTALTTLNFGDNVVNIPDYAFKNCGGLSSVTIPNSVTYIGYDAFSGTPWYNNQPDGVVYINNVLYDYKGTMPEGTTINIKEGTVSITPNAFRNCTGLTSVTIPNSVTSIGSSAFSSCSGLTSVTIPNSVTSIGESAFWGCRGLTEVIIPNSVTTIGYHAFYLCTGLVDCNIEKTHTSAIIGLSSGSNCSPYFYSPNSYYKDGDIITGLSPYTNARNWSASSGCYSYDYGLTVNGKRCIIESGYYYTKQINLNIEGTTGVTYIDCSWSHIDDDATLVSEEITINNSSIETEDNTIQLRNLDPDTTCTFDFTLQYKGFSSKFNFTQTFTTSALELTTQEAKPTSTTSVRLLAATNCDATEGTGFEWRRYDAPDELPSSKVSCPVVDGVLVGSLRGVNADVYYKYRPYYTSSSGNTYYGEWVAFITGDANVYFEPDVRTYDDTQVINNSATVKGYALEGTDVITAQGFEYWKTGSTITPSSTENRMIVNASGISMSATLANLEYNSTYKYRAYVKTAQGTFYGTEMEFSTGEDPAGIDYIEVDADEFAVTLRENPATGIAWVKIAGAAGEEVQYTLTSMSGAMMATGIVKIDGEWNAIELNCNSGIYLLTINDGLQVKTVRLIVQ